MVSSASIRIVVHRASLAAQMVNKSPAMQRPGFGPWIRKINWRREWLPSRYSCPENPTDRGAWLLSVGSQRIRYNWATKLTQTHAHKNHPVISDEERINALKGWLKRDYYPVSIAAFHRGKLWENDDEDRYFCYIRAKKRVQSVYNPVSTLAIVYYNNRWSLVAIEFE